jgi:muramoyltetrapeptide carboxypeptidase LdcA involved in peptidoglycan recycling
LEEQKDINRQLEQMVMSEEFEKVRAFVASF